MADVFAGIVGQPDAVATLRRAVAAAQQTLAGADGPGMTHAWLFTGPPGSGRSDAARAFAAALQCPRGGCNACQACHTVLAGTHPDVRFVVPDGLTIGVDSMRSLVLRAQGAPADGRWQVLVITDADRLTEQAGNALLKAVEEPPARTVFLLCTPSTHPDDISVTIRSRCRLITLRLPSTDAVAESLVVRDGVDEPTARWAAAAAQGHIGRARALATDPDARATRDAVLAIPRALTSLAACFDVADTLLAATEQENATTAELNAAERAELATALGAGGTGKGATAATRGSAAALKDLERRQKTRTTRGHRDALDRALTDLAGFYRDVLTATLHAPVPPVHADATDLATRAAARWTPHEALHRLEAVLACRDAIDANVKPRIALEALMTSLWRVVRTGAAPD